MAITATPTVINGVYVPGALEYTTLSGSALKATLKVNISGAPDVLFAIVDLTACSTGTYTVKFIAGDHSHGGGSKTVTLTDAKVNVIPITSREIKNFNGTAEFEIETSVSGGFSSAAPKFALVKYAPVVNH